MKTTLCAAALLGAVAPASAQTGANVEQVLGVGMISRNGDRGLLDQRYNEQRMTLTDRGYRRMQGLGAYLKQNMAPKIGLDGDGLSLIELHSDVEVWSSGFDRTIASGEAVMDGLFDHKLRRPVVFSAPETNDIVLRPLQCKQFDTLRFQTAQTNEYYQLEAAYKAAWRDNNVKEILDRRLQGGVYETFVGAAYSLYDSLLVIVRDLGAEDEATRQELQTVINVIQPFALQLLQLEFAPAENFNVMGPLMRRIREHIEELVEGTTDVIIPKYQHWFTHLEPLVSLMITLGIPLTKLPDFGTTLYYEVVYNQGIQERHSGTSIRWYILEPSEAAANGSVTVTGLEKQVMNVPYTKFLDETEAHDIGEQAWCSICEQSDTPIEECQKFFPRDTVTSTQAPAAPVPTCPTCPACTTEVKEDVAAWKVLLLLLTGIVLGALITIVVMRFCSKRSSQKYQAPSMPSPYASGQANPVGDEELRVTA